MRLTKLLPLLLLLSAPRVGRADVRAARKTIEVRRRVAREKQRHERIYRAPPTRRTGDLQKALLSFTKSHPYTLGHSVRVAGYVEATARKLGIDESDIPGISRAALVHDLGKLKVSLTILDDKKKRSDRGGSALSERQYRNIKRHPSFGVEILDSALSPRHPEYQLMRDAILFHHERPDGKGYYRKNLASTPLVARLIAVADVYDSLTSRRSYRDPMPRAKALQIIEEGAGTQFDRRVVQAFKAALEEHGLRPIGPRTKIDSLNAIVGRP